MSDSKKVTLGDLASKQRLRRLLFYRFGPIAIEPNFPLALGAHEAGTITPSLQAEVDASGLDVLKDVVRLFDQIDNLVPGSYDSARYGIYQAYLDYLLIRSRPPTLAELRRREWEERELPALRTRITTRNLEELSRHLAQRYRDTVKIEKKSSGHSPMDTSLLRTRVAKMGLVLLDGEALRIYRRLFRELDGSQDPPTLGRFTEASLEDETIGRRLASRKAITDEPLEALVEVMAAPFDLHPFNRWVQSYEMNMKALPARLESLPGVSAQERSQALALFDLFFRLGTEMEVIIEGSQPTAGLFPSPEGQDLIRRRFLRLADETRAIPTFSELWLSDGEPPSILKEFGELDESKLGLLEELTGALRGDVEIETTVVPIARIAESIPTLGFLASAFASAYQVHEPMIFWHALHDPSLHEKGGGSTADFLRFTPPF